MPFALGIYTGTSNTFNNAVNGTIIDPADWNELFTDIELGLNDLSAGRVYAPTNVVSAATCDIGATDTSRVVVTGSTGPITSLGTSPNRIRFVSFTGTPTLTHHATNLILPGGADITVVAGDCGLFSSDATGKWRCLVFSRSDGDIVFLQSGTGAVERTAQDKMRDWVSILDFDDVDSTGVSSSTAGFTAADAAVATGTIIYVPQGTYNLGSAPTLTRAAWLVSPGASFTGSGASTIFTVMGRGYYTDKGSGTNLVRLMDRVLIDAANLYAGTTDSTDGETVIGSGEINSFYLERSAALASISSYGGIGVLGGAKASMRYSAWGYGIWVAGEAVTIGTKRGYGGRLYTATTTGTTGATPLTHTTGTASDGTVTWQFDDYTYTASIGGAFVVEQDALDSQGAWGLYNEAVRASGAGTVYAREVPVKNKGSDVVNNPYNRFGTGGGATIGDWFAAGGDSSLGAPANPSTCAILIGSGASDWNKGIVFEDGSLVGPAIAMAEAQEVAWYVSGGTKRGTLSYASNYLTFTGAVTGYSFDALVAPAASDGAPLGSTGRMWSDLFLASGAVINFNSGDVTVTHDATTLAFAGASSGYTFDAAPLPSADDAAALGASGTAWADLFIASGGVINFNAGDVTITHSNNTLSFNSATTGYLFGQGPVRPSTDNAVSLGTSAAGFADLFLAAGGEIRLNNVQLLDTVGGLSTQTATAAAIAAVGNAINTANKRAGKIIYDTTNNRLMVASGANATDAWYVADASASVTPA